MEIKLVARLERVALAVIAVLAVVPGVVVTISRATPYRSR
jgi:hypothetical protein